MELSDESSRLVVLVGLAVLAVLAAAAAIVAVAAFVSAAVLRWLPQVVSWCYAESVWYRWQMRLPQCHGVCPLRAWL